MLNREQFDQVYAQLRVSEKLDKEFIFDVYQNCSYQGEQISNNNALGKVTPINPVQLLLYIINEYGFYLDTHQEINEDQMGQIVASIALDKYFTNEHFSFQNDTKISKYHPQVSTITIYLNFVLGILSRYKKDSPRETLITDILRKGFKIVKASTELIVDGFETEAFSTWRTLHETECILHILFNNSDEVIKSYLRHMDYAMAYRGVIADKAKVDDIFVEIKANMAKLGLKSKDMKKYIEYGWLITVPGAQEIEGFKLNFRDGVERVANLSNYSKTYEMASEIAHSSPLLIYSRQDFFLHVALVNILESFFRLEKVFVKIYLSNISKEEAARYLAMRNIYYAELEAVYKKEKDIFLTKNRK